LAHSDFLPTTLRKLTTSIAAQILCVSHLTDLTYLKLKTSHCQSEGFSLLTNLTTLKIESNSNIKEEHVTDLTNLTHLEFKSSPFSDLGVAKLPKLTRLVRLVLFEKTKFDILETVLPYFVVFYPRFTSEELGTDSDVITDGEGQF
jgi:hypothetical protein